MNNATYAAACESKVKPGGEADNLMIARYANAMAALQDLHNEGYTYFVLRPRRGSFLEPLKVFGSPIQRGPNAPEPVGLEQIPSAAPDLDQPTQMVREWTSAVIARFPTEFLLQLDLGNEGYGFYAFAYDEGTMFTIAALSRDDVTNGQGFGVSRALEPLEDFGFNVYSTPGLP